MPNTPIMLTEHNIKVLLIDDQRIVGETIRRMLVNNPDIPGLEYRFCSDPSQALAEADAFLPTVILQDLIMPGIDGIDMVRAFRIHPSTCSVPLIVLSSKEEPTTKAEAFGVRSQRLYLVKAARQARDRRPHPLPLRRLHSPPGARRSLRRP